MATEAANSYEEQRRRQVEENKRKLEELRLLHLSAAVREAAARPKPNPNPNPRPKRKAPGPDELRRSGRVASLPERPDYVEGAELRDSMYDAYAASSKGPTDEERADAVAKAEELRRRIHRIRRPAFVRTVSHICASRARPMAIPHHFIQYLPAGDEAVVVADEADAEFYMMYNASKQGRHPYLSKGWREFVLHHDLANGDCLVFQLKERAMFKVYIIRANPDYERDETSDDYEDED